jgi:IclR family pca regulon transcriptional regulator
MAEADSEMTGGDDSQIIHSVERALRVLQVFSPAHPQLTLSEMAKIIGLSRATTRRILITFEHLGFVRQNGRFFSPTPRVLRLGYGFLSSLPYWDRAQPHVRGLADSVDEASSIAVFDDPDVVYVLRVPSQRQQTVTLTIGTRLPAYPTSLGQVLLAGLSEAELDRYLERTPLEQLTPKTITDKDELRAVLERTREQGYSVSNGGRELGVLSVAAPITNRRGEVIAALNVSTNPARISVSELRARILPQVVSTAKSISDDLRYI